ncbi:mandelate racemase/muconate lactonizing enzyme family protein [Aestuariispira insulae]|uniref:Galactarate dehydratase /L-talarate dehydratase n=1 Tax=Aestuariispira insulae TaxID=1461337 RepID=A0A3D9HGE5_9PROT|nr:mandelate racemase/muconate lactonizing enzyme family protein [Aestuariispira insulae]RED48559.1 galactarate dehydratase /L-talarate dehydratase [Aestuariispira insulae]
MKITRLKTIPVDVPLDKPLKTAIHDIRSVGCVLLRLETDVGLVGESYIFTINAVRLKAFDEMIKGFAHQVEGRDPHYVEAIWQAIWSEINPTGHKGVTISALTAIDTACWDLVGKAAEKPLHHLFGAVRDRIWTYASGGLWLHQTIDELQAEAQSFLDQGFRSMKVRVGKPDAREDFDRVKAVRDVVGPEVQLMVDANQSFAPKQAVRLGRMLEELDLYWFEEPVPAYDLEGHAEVRTRLDMNIASGETEYTKHGMKAMIETKACDILMPDLQRIGGLSEMRRVAALAEAHNMPISTHIFTEHSLSIAGSASNCISVEHMPWYAPLFNEEMPVKDGYLHIPDRPGCGFTFSESAIQRYML